MEPAFANRKIAVVLPCYNSEKFLATTLNSILSQAHDSFYVLAIDDCSTDGTRELLKDVQAKFPDKIALHFNSQNMGVSNTLKFAFNNIESDLIAWPGHDDIWPIDFLAKAQSKLEITKSIAVFASVRYVNASGDVIHRDIFRHELLKKLNRDELLRRLIRGNFLCAPASLMKNERAVLRNVTSWNDRLQDFEIWLKLCLRGSFCYLENTDISYRVHGNNLSSEVDELPLRYDYVSSLSSFLNDEIFPLYYESLDSASKVSLLDSLYQMTGYCPPLVIPVLNFINTKTAQQSLEERIVVGQLFADIGLCARALSASPKTKWCVPRLFIHQSVRPPEVRALAVKLERTVDIVSFLPLATPVRGDEVFLTSPDSFNLLANDPHFLKALAESRVLLAARDEDVSYWKSNHPNLNTFSATQISSFSSEGLKVALAKMFQKAQLFASPALKSTNLTATKSTPVVEEFCIEEDDYPLWSLMLPDSDAAQILVMMSDDEKVVISRTIGSKSPDFLAEIPNRLPIQKSTRFLTNSLKSKWITANNSLYVLRDYEMLITGGLRAIFCKAGTICDFDPLDYRSASTSHAPGTITIHSQTLVNLKKRLDRTPRLKKFLIWISKTFVRMFRGLGIE